MTTVCHIKKIFRKNYKNMEFHIYFCYNVNMKKILSFILLFALIVINILSINNITIFADGPELKKLDYTITNIDDYSQIDYYSNHILLTSNQNVVIANDEVNLFQNTDTETGIYNPKISVMTTNYFFVFDELNRIQIYNQNLEFVKSCKYVESDSLYNLGNVLCCSKDYSGNLYLADKTNQKILFLNFESLTIKEIAINFDDFADKMSISVNPNGDLLSLYSNGKVYIYDLQNKYLIKSFDCTANKIMFDYMDNLFIQNEQNIYKYQSANYEIAETKTLTTTIEDIVLDIETGSFYILSDDLYNYSAQNFASNPSNENIRIDLTTATKQTSQVKFATANIETKLYTTSMSYSSSFDIQQEQLVMILQENVAENINMYYCLTNINDNQMQGYIQKNDFQILENENHNIECKTICKNVEVKTYPTHTASTYTTIQNDDTELIVLGTCHNFVDDELKTYYAVQLADGVGYIEQQYLVSVNQFESYLTDIIEIPDNSTQFMAYIITAVSLFVITLFVSLLIMKKIEKNKINK